MSCVQAGITCVVAAGNSGEDAALYSPSHVAEAITVGAFDSSNVIAPWSNYGAVVDVLAPGVNILTTFMRGKYGSMSGTSFSAPHVAGAAALFLVKSPSATPDAVAQALKDLAAAASAANPDIVVTFPNTTKRSIYISTL